MGKKFLKLFGDSAAKPKKESPNGGSAGGVPELPADEQAQQVGSNAPVGPVEDLRPINIPETLAEESATRFTPPVMDLEEFEPLPDGQSYLKILSEQTGLRLIDLNDYQKPNRSVIGVLTKDQAERLTALPVAEEDGCIVIAVGDPSNPMITDDLRAIVDAEIEPVIADAEAIKEKIDVFFGLGEETLEDLTARAEEEEEKQIKTNQQLVEIASDVEELANDPPVIRLVNLLLVKAIKERASDIHIEPFPSVIRIRYRVDGVLREIPSPPRNMLQGLITRVKVMGHLNISESRLPQDGRIKLGFDGREVDLRVSTVPTIHGESIVMRVLDKSMMQIGIGQIGMPDDVLEGFLSHIKKPNGIVLVTGPTGCGKTTTLYAGLNEINDPNDKLITVEDPVEFELDGLVQVNINDNVGLTFARTLRAILRQDPDKVLVGEIRDVETAQISVQAALTGHLVFSTLHTNSSAATIIRLIDMGVPGFLITSSVEAILAQRLVRTVCPNCRQSYTPTEEEMDEFELSPEDIEGESFFMGDGCSDCMHTGYKGRMGLFELFEMDEEIRDLILDGATTDELQEVAVRKGMRTMREDGWNKVRMGLTTFEEVGRETPKPEREPDAGEYQPEDLDDEDGPEAIDEDKKEKIEKKPEPKRLPKLEEDTMTVSGEEAKSIDIQEEKPA